MEATVRNGRVNGIKVKFVGKLLCLNMLYVEWLCLFYLIVLWGWTLYLTGEYFPYLNGSQ